MKTEYTQEQLKVAMRSYINSHYIDLKHAAISIAKSNLWEELLHETLLAVLSAKTIPADIIIRGKEFVYIYVIMKRKLYQNKAKFIKDFSFKGYEQDRYNKQHYNIKSEIPTEEKYSFELEVVYNKTFEIVNNLHFSGKISSYELKAFLLYFFHEDAMLYTQISKSKYLQLINSPTYRTIQNITGISFQSIRITVLKVLKLVKEQMPSDLNFFDEPDNFLINKEKVIKRAKPLF